MYLGTAISAFTALRLGYFSKFCKRLYLALPNEFKSEILVPVKLIFLTGETDEVGTLYLVF